jgi:hypothetical protein
MYVPFFVVICLMYIQASSPMPWNWISPLYGTSWSTQKCRVPRHICRTSAAFQFHHLPNNVSLPLYGEMKRQYFTSPWTPRKLNALCISATMQVFVTLERAIFSCRCNGRAWSWSREQRIFLVTFLELPCFYFSVLYSKDSNVWRV